MNLQTLRESVIRRIKQRPLVSGIAGLAVIALVAALFMSSGKPVQAYSFYDVKRGDFLVSIVEGGGLEAVNEVVVRNEVEGTARIIYIVPEGTEVKKGDRLVELDSSQAQDEVNLQEINVEKAQFGVKQAEAALEIQKSVEDSNLQAASNKLVSAEMDLKKFIEGQAEQLRRNAEIDITNVLEDLQIAAERLQWTEVLYTNGFENKADLDKDRLTVNQSRLKLEQATNTLWMTLTYDIPKSQREYEAARDEARENLGRAILQADRRISQAESDLTTQKRTLQLSQEKLERDKKQLEGTKIFAPQDGLVVYASPSGGGRGFSSESMIEEGATVRYRQELIKLPDVSAMKLTVKVHESHINEVHLGQPAYVVMDAMPDQRFAGVVSKVAPLPDSQSRFANPDLKVYVTEILVQDKLPDVKPGVSARAEILITNLPGVLTVPMQAVTTRKGKQVVFLASAPDRPVPVKVGMFNTKFIEITSGLNEGDQVMLAPPFDSKDKDLGGSILAEGETAPSGATNPAALALARNGNGNGADEFQDDVAGAGRGARGGGDWGDLQAVFKQCDTNNDGTLDANELAAFFSKMGGGFGGAGLGGSLTNRQELMNLFDANKDGQVDENELNAGMRRVFAHQANRGAPPAAPGLN
jgi:HlyD family secretion protein